MSSKDLLEKYEYLTGEYLGHRPSALEKTDFEYSPLGKIFNKGLTEEEKKEGLLKRLKNIEGKIKNEDKKQSEPIKNDKQSEPLKNQSDLVDKKSKEIVLPKDRLDSIFENFGSNFNNTGKKFLKKLAKDEKKLIIIICFLTIMTSLLLKVLIFYEKLVHCMIYWFIYLAILSKSSFLQKIKSVSLK